MFHNIFAPKKPRKIKEQFLPEIIADTREKNSLVIAELKSSCQIQLKLAYLKIGDYLIKDTIIERKTTSDFISSLISRRLKEQLNNAKSYPKQLLIIESQNSSDLKKSKIHENAIRGAILSIIYTKNIPIIFTKNCNDTAQYLIILAHQLQNQNITPSFYKKTPKTSDEQKQLILQSFPNIGPKTAQKLIQKFHTIKNTINAPSIELKEILKTNTESFLQLVSE